MWSDPVLVPRTPAPHLLLHETEVSDILEQTVTFASALSRTFLCFSTALSALREHISCVFHDSIPQQFLQVHVLHLVGLQLVLMPRKVHPWSTLPSSLFAAVGRHLLELSYIVEVFHFCLSERD